jgi:AAA domain
MNTIDPQPDINIYAREFLASVVPSDCGGFLTIHWQYPEKDGFPGRSFQTIDAALQWVAELQTGPHANIYFCLSRQRLNSGQRSRKNAMALQCVWADVDVDPDDPRKYPSLPEAIAALLRCCVQLGIPRPSLLVASGGGLHAYWLSDRPLSVEEWQPFADALKTALKSVDLKFDAGVTSDAARVLRVPGTQNWKKDKPRSVYLLQSPKLKFCNGVRHDFAAAFGKISADTPSSPLKLAKAFRHLDPADSLGRGIVLHEIPPLPFAPIKAECAWLREAHDTGGKEFDNPQWSLTTMSAVFLEHGHELAHAFGNKHEGYTYDSTEKKWEEKQRAHERGVGWPGCKEIRGAGAKHCESCPHLAEGKSPLNLGFDAVNDDHYGFDAVIDGRYTGTAERPLPPPLPFINFTNWDHEPIPEYEWSVLNRYPLRQTILSTGEGAVGKSLLKLQLTAAHALCGEWLGVLPAPGAAIFVDAEEDVNALHIRLAAILRHYGATFADAVKGGLHLISLAGHDAVLGAPTARGKSSQPPSTSSCSKPPVTSSRR